MSLYPEGSTDGSLRLGNIVPDFSAETTHGPIESFHEWKKGKWAILFSVRPVRCDTKTEKTVLCCCLGVPC